MNSLLQCFFYIPELRNYFINEMDNFNENKQPVCQALSEVMIGLYYDNKNYFEPVKFQKIMGSKNSLFSDFRAADTKDLFFNIIDSLLNELLKEEKTKSVISYMNDSEKIQMFKDLENEIDQNNIINKLFIGYYENIYKCETYNKYTFSFNTEAFIIFNLQQISNYYNNAELSLEDCFEYNFGRRYSTSFYCSICQKTETNISEEKIYKPPKILVLILDRGKGKSYKEKISFELKLDLKNFIEEKEKNYSSEYELISFITHNGPSSQDGHYTSYCLTDNGKFYFFNDEYVNNITISDGRLIYHGEPYLLFYKRKEQDNFNDYLYQIE